MFKSFWLYVLLFFSHIAYGMNVGSDTFVTRFNNQVSLTEQSRIAGFAGLNNGFLLTDVATRALFDSFFPVSGTIQLNGGTLNLNQDLILQAATEIITLGNINGNFHRIEFAPGPQIVPSGNVQTGCSISFITDETQLDLANEVTWSFDSAYVAVAINDAGGASNQVLVYSFDGTTLTFEDGVDVATDVFCISWHPTNDWIAFGRNSGGGSELYIYNFDRATGTLSLLSSTNIGGDVNSVAWHPSGGHLALGSNNNAIRVRVYVVSGAGALGANVTVNPGADANAVDWNSEGTFLAVGRDSGGGSDLLVYSFTSSPLALNLNAGVDVGNQVNSVAWNKIAGNNDLIAIGVNAGTGRVRVYRHNSSFGTLTLLTAAQAINATIVNFVDWHPLFNCLAACLNVNAEGAGGEIRIYQFANDALSEEDSEELGDSVFGGRWSPDGNYFASADNGGGPGGPELSIYGLEQASVPECATTFFTGVTQLAAANEVSWSSDSEYVAVAINDAGGAAEQILVYSFDGISLTFRGGVDVGGNVNTVSWHPTNDWIAFGRTTGAGSELYIYSFNRTSGALALLSSVNIANTVNSVAWHPAGGHLALGSNNNAIRVRVYVVSGAGALGASVTVNPGADANAVDWNSAGTFLAVGIDTVAGDDLLVYAFNSTLLTLTLNAGVDVANQVNSVAWNRVAGNTDLIAIGVNAGTGRVRVYRHNSGLGTLTLLVGAQAINVTIVNFVDWHPYASCLAACLNVNTEGTGGEIRIYRFASDTLTQDTNQELGDSVFAGRWSPNGRYFASADNGAGSVSPELSIYGFDSYFQRNFIFSNLRWFLGDNITLQDGSITFTGSNLIDGRDNCLTLLPTVTLKIAQDSGILLQNIRIEGLKNSSIQLLDTTSTLSFRNCTFVMDEDITFNQGKFDVVQGFNLEGASHSFIYTSNQKSRILEQGKLVVDTDVTFSYYPSISSNALLEMTHASSILKLQSATLATSNAGLLLTKGIVQVDGKSFLNNDGTVQAAGLFFGDGINTENNIALEIEPAAQLAISSGFFTSDSI